MDKKSNIPWFLPLANNIVSTMMRIGLKLSGPGKCPMYLFTVNGRKSGLPRTTPIAVVEMNGNRYVMTPYGVVDWVRNVRAAGEATFTRGRRAEQIHLVEMPLSEATPVLKKFIESGNPIGKFFEIAPTASQEEFDKLATTHPVFLLQSASAMPESVRHAQSA